MGCNLWQDDEWCRYIPALHRRLASPSLDSNLPESFRGLDFQQTCAWWETLRYLFKSLLGWEDLPSGLAWWYSKGCRSLGDTRLELVQERWNVRGELDAFAAREWKSSGFTGLGNAPESALSKDFEPSEGWFRSVDQMEVVDCYISPYGGGSNPLHLGHSDWVGLVESSESPISTYDEQTRKATLVVSSFNSWKYELKQFGRSLPSLKKHSWHVEVFDRSVGYLGLFRQSRVTGLWFQGKHSLHMMGNQAPPR
jgi:hypothetical protein